MKKIILIMQFLAISFAMNAQITKVEIMATGLTCSMCSNAINKQLKKISDVEKVDIDLNKNLFTITLKNINNINPKTFKEKVEKAGFFVGSMVLFVNFSNQLIENNKQVDNYIFMDTNAQTLDGIAKLKVLNKGFVTAKEFKKLEKKYAKYNTYSKNNDDIFHVKTM